MDFICQFQEHNPFALKTKKNSSKTLWKLFPPVSFSSFIVKDWERFFSSLFAFRLCWKFWCFRRRGDGGGEWERITRHIEFLGFFPFSEIPPRISKIHALFFCKISENYATIVSTWLSCNFHRWASELLVHFENCSKISYFNSRCMIFFL